MSSNSTLGTIKVIESISDRHHTIGNDEGVVAEVYADIGTALHLASAAELLGAAKHVIETAYKYDGEMFNGTVSISALNRLQEALKGDHKNDLQRKLS